VSRQQSKEQIEDSKKECVTFWLWPRAGGLFGGGGMVSAMETIECVDLFKKIVYTGVPVAIEKVVYTGLRPSWKLEDLRYSDRGNTSDKDESRGKEGINERYCLQGADRGQACG
jgi:hypothetical protein